jgi:hypothetical protein
MHAHNILYILATFSASCAAAEHLYKSTKKLDSVQPLSARELTVVQGYTLRLH